MFRDFSANKIIEIKDNLLESSNNLTNLYVYIVISKLLSKIINYRISCDGMICKQQGNDPNQRDFCGHLYTVNPLHNF